MYKYLILFLTFSPLILAQRRQGQRFRNQQIAQFQQQPEQPYTTPVPILRQINTHNDDGSYTYGYEGADGTYKVETKSAAGEVQGKYGYYDDAGTLREIEYGATRNGFVPSGTDINVPPPVINSANSAYQDYDDDGLYRPDIHERPYEYQPENLAQAQPNGNFIAQPAPRRSGGRRFQQQQPQQQFQPQLQARSAQPQPQFQYDNFGQSQYYQPQPQSQARFNQQQQSDYQRSYSTNALPVYQQPRQLHPAVPNFDVGSGAYSINY